MQNEAPTRKSEFQRRVIGLFVRKAMAEEDVVGQNAAPGAAMGMAYGNTTNDAYEAGEKEKVANLRQIGNQAVYRRGRVWVASNATKMDPVRDQDKIRVVNRYSEEYFDLVRANTVEENQILASQGSDEELLITLRGEAVLIK